MNKVIQLSNYQKPQPFDFESYNRRAEVRFRNSEIRAWAVHVTETLVTAAIGICTVVCVIMALTML